MGDLLALTEDQNPGDIEDLNAKIADLIRAGNLAERARASRQSDTKWRAQELAYDNQGVRYGLLGLYLATKRREAADNLLLRYPGEENYSAVFSWGRVIERWLANCEAEAQSALLRARRVNPSVEKYLAGVRQLPEHLPPGYRPGDESEAQVAAFELSPLDARVPEFAAWLRKQRYARSKV